MNESIKASDQGLSFSPWCGSMIRLDFRSGGEMSIASEMAFSPISPQNSIADPPNPTLRARDISFTDTLWSFAHAAGGFRQRMLTPFTPSIESPRLKMKRLHAAILF